MSLFKCKKLLRKVKEMNEKQEQDIKPYYLEKDIVFELALSSEDEKNLRKVLVKIMNMNEKEKAIKEYFRLMTQFGEKTMDYILKTTKIKDDEEAIGNSSAFKEFQKLLETKWIMPFNVIIGINPYFVTTNPKQRRENAIYSKDYVILDRNEKESYKDDKKINEDYRDLKVIYSRINQAIIYNMTDVLTMYVPFLMEHPCYHWLFSEYPELCNYIPKKDVPTKTYQRKKRK